MVNVTVKGGGGGGGVGSILREVDRVTGSGGHRRLRMQQRCWL
jgi:hypothetical protein